MFLDGVRMFHEAETGTYSGSSSIPFAIGNQPAVANDNRGLQGRVDEVLIFQVESAGQGMSEVRQHACLAQWRFTRWSS